MCILHFQPVGPVTSCICHPSGGEGKTMTTSVKIGWNPRWCHIPCHTPTSCTPSSQLGTSTEAPFLVTHRCKGPRLGHPSVARVRAARTRRSRCSAAARWPPHRSSFPHPSSHGAEPRWEHPLAPEGQLGRVDATLRPIAPEAELTSTRKGIGHPVGSSMTH